MNNLTDRWYWDAVPTEDINDVQHLIVDSDGYLVVGPCKMNEETVRHIVELHNKEIGI